jgi:hypothetical protein
MIRFSYGLILLFSSNIFAGALVCERLQSVEEIETIKYSICLLREANSSHKYVGIRYHRQNVSDKIIRLFVSDSESPWRFQISLEQGRKEVFSWDEHVYDDDMRISVKPASSLVVMAPNAIIEGDLFFSELTSEIVKNYPEVNFKGKFSIDFLVRPAFLRENEALSERDAALARDKESMVLKSEYLLPYSGISIDWRYTKRK